MHYSPFWLRLPWREVYQISAAYASSSQAAFRVRKDQLVLYACLDLALAESEYEA